jgi:hypothetical protein
MKDRTGSTVRLLIRYLESDQMQRWSRQEILPPAKLDGRPIADFT